MLAGRPGSLLQCQGGAGKLSDGAGIMKGEGEESFTELVAYYGKLKERKQLRDIEGLMFRDENGEIIETENRPILDLSTVPFVYEHIEDFRTGSFTMSPAEDVHFPAVTVFLP